MKGTIDTMHFATTHRWAIFACRLAMGIFVTYSALFLFMPNTVHAQNYIGPGRPPVEAFPAGFTQSDAVPIDNYPAAMSPAAANPIASAPSEIIHVIAVGDNLTRVAQQYGVEPADLAAHNQIVDYNHVVIGQKLRIPPVGMQIAKSTKAEPTAVEPVAELVAEVDHAVLGAGLDLDLAAGARHDCQQRQRRRDASDHPSSW